MEPFRLDGERLWILDQTLLPREERWIEIADARGMVDAITRLRVRGAPAIGIAGALGLWLEARRIVREEGGRAQAGPGSVGLLARAGIETLRSAARSIRVARPTAANLGWAVDRVLRVAEEAASPRSDAGVSAEIADAETWTRAILAEALAIWEEDRAASRAMARWGASLFRSETRFLTHCHTGGLATGGGGTALGVLLVKLPRQAAGALGVGGEEQFHHVFGGVHAARGVHARRDLKRHLPRVGRRLAGEARHFEQRAQSQIAHRA